jgi:hypothetical protein
MGMMDTVKQYGSLVVAFLMVFGFGATFLLYDTGGGGGTQTQQERELDFSSPDSRFVVGSLDRNYREQVRIAATEDSVFVNAYYRNESQRESLRDLRSVLDTFPGRVYIQVKDFLNASNIPTRLGATEYPSVAVLGGYPSSRGIVPSSSVVSPVNQTAVERAVCNALTNVGDQFAYCRSIDAFK